MIVLGARDAVEFSPRFVRPPRKTNILRESCTVRWPFVPSPAGFMSEPTAPADIIAHLATLEATARTGGAPGGFSSKSS